MKILVIDDHGLFREGLCHVLNELDASMQILEAADFDRAWNCVNTTPDLDLVLLDLHMPGKDGFSALDSFAKHYPTIPVVIVSASNQRSDVQRALDAGAMGFIPKESTSKVMLGALRLILDGGIYVPSSLSQHETPSVTNANKHGLTPRQLDVLLLLAQGYSNKEIAARMSLAEATIKMHVTAIMKALGVTNRTQAAMVAEKMGLRLTSN